MYSARAAAEVAAASSTAAARSTAIRTHPRRMLSLVVGDRPRAGSAYGSLIREESYSSAPQAGGLAPTSTIRNPGPRRHAIGAAKKHETDEPTDYRASRSHR